MEVSRTVSNFSQFKKEWFGFEIDWLLHKGIRKSDIAADLGMTGAALSMALSRMPSDAFLDRFVKAYKLSFVINKAYEGYGIFYIERGDVLSAITYPDCRPMDKENKYFSFSEFKKAWLKMEIDDLKENGLLKKSIAKQLSYTKVSLSTYTTKAPSDNLANTFCKSFNIQFSITKYFNEESMAINGKFTLNSSEKNQVSKETSGFTTLSNMYLKISEEKYHLEQELKKKEEEIANLKQQIEKLQAKAGK